MKIQIVVGATLSGQYPMIIKASKETWDSIQHPNFLKTIYLYGSNDKEKRIVTCDNSIDFYAPVEDIRGNEHIKFKHLLDSIAHTEFDYLIIGSSSSYWDKARLLTKIESLAKDKIYCGIDGGGFASGCGRILSRDVVEILRKNLPIHYPCMDEDCLIGSLLINQFNIPITMAERVQYNHDTHRMSRCYHYRCKHESNAKEFEVIAFNNLLKGECFYDVQ